MSDLLKRAADALNARKIAEQSQESQVLSLAQASARSLAMNVLSIDGALVEIVDTKEMEGGHAVWFSFEGLKFKAEILRSTKTLKMYGKCPSGHEAYGLVEALADVGDVHAHGVDHYDCESCAADAVDRGRPLSPRRPRK